MPGTFNEEPIFPTGLPATTSELLTGLDRCIPIRPFFNPEALDSETERLRIARECGRRQLVDELLAIQRQAEKQRRGRSSHG